MPRKVVITGIGAVTPAGTGKNKLWENSLSGHSGIGPLEALDTSDFPTTMGAEVRGFKAGEHIHNLPVKNMDRTARFATAAANMALMDSGLAPKIPEVEKAGVVVGTTLGTISFILDQQQALDSGRYNSIHRYTGYMALHNSLSSDISLETGAKGVSETLSSACVSGLSAVDYGMRRIMYDDYDIMLAGAADSAFRPLPYAGLNVVRLLTDSALRPFDDRADGTVLGEGAGMLILEEMEHAKKRGAHIYCEVDNSALACESYNHFGHDRNPEVARGVLEKCTKSIPDRRDIDLVVTHGLGVRLSDVFENAVYEGFFGRELCGEVPFSSIKPYIGHPLAAASALQIIYCILMMENGKVLATLNHEQAGKEMCLKVVKQPLDMDINNALIFTTAFGGKCGACLLRK